jgi:hypothetical protein
MRLGSETAREQVTPIPEFDLRQPIMDRGSGLLGDFELDRSPRLFLNHGATVPHPATSLHVVDLQADKIAASELAVDREVEQSEISFPALQLKPNAMAQTSFGLRGRFCPIKRPLFQETHLQETGIGIAVCIVASSIPTVPLPALPMRRQVSMGMRPPIGLRAPMARRRRNRPSAASEIAHMPSAQVDTHLRAAHAIERRETSGQDVG